MSSITHCAQAMKALLESAAVKAYVGERSWQTRVEGNPDQPYVVWIFMPSDNIDDFDGYVRNHVVEVHVWDDADRDDRADTVQALVRSLIEEDFGDYLPSDSTFCGARQTSINSALFDEQWQSVATYVITLSTP